MDESTSDPQRPREYHVLVEGQMHGPFTAESLKAALETGDVTPEDLVQVGGLPIWRPLRQVLESPQPRNSSPMLPASAPPPIPPPAAEEAAVRNEGEVVPSPVVPDVGANEVVESVPLENLEPTSIAPEWKEIGQTAWNRLKEDFEERSVGTGLVCLAIGVVACLLAFWPFLFWLPWFGLAFYAGFDALKRGKTLPGLGLLVAACAFPIVLSTTISHLRSRSNEPSEFRENGTGAEPLPAGTPRPTDVARVPKSELTPATTPQVAPVVIESVKPVQPPAQLAPKAVPATPPPAVMPHVPVAATPFPVPPSQPNVNRAGGNQANANVPAVSTPQTVPAVNTVVPALTPPVLTTPPAGTSLGGGDLVQRHRNSFVVVKDGSSSGSGFICRDGPKTWLFTNAHVAAGMRNPQFSRLDGSLIRVSSIEAGGARDVIRFGVTDAVEPLEILPNLDASVRIGDEIVVLGNSGGGGVVTSLTGKLVGIGPDRIEVTAEFIPGNSGSPIIHIPTGKVIGIATYLTRRYEEFSSASNGSKAPDGTTVRRFGYRVDQIPNWEPVNWAAFHAEAEQLRQISALTADVFDFLDAIRERSEPQFQTATLRRPATDWLTGIRRQNVSEVDRNRATQAFLSSLRFMVRADVTAAENRLRFSYFRERLSKEREVRDRLFKAFDDEVKKMSSPSLR